MFTEKDLLQFRQQLSACHKEMQAILSAANGESLSDEQSTKFKKLDAKCGELESNVDKAEADVAILNRHAGRSVSQTDPIPRQSQADPITITNQRDGFLSDPARGFSSHREFLDTILGTAQDGKLSDQRLASLAVGSDEHSTVADPYGGFLLPAAFSPDLLSVMAEGDPTAGRTTAIPMQTGTVEIPARTDKNHSNSVSGGLRVYRRNETDTSSSSRMEIEQVKLNAQMLFGVAYATEELLARSPISFTALLEAGFSDEFASKILKEKLFGTGAGEMEGVVNSPCTVETAKETGQAATTIVYENVINMRSRCWGYGNAIWIANHDTLPQLMLMNQDVGTGGVPVWQPSAREDHPDMLLGRPLFFSEFAETLGTVGDVILANWSQYLEGTLSGQTSAESIHVRFVNHERTFKFTMENDGRCWWRSALTPNKSSTTLSPIVTLAARA